MSAIAGLLQLDGAPVQRATLQRMQSLLTPYGRDAQQSWQQDNAGFVHTLLRITPEDALERQPLWHAPSQTLLLFDGRLDNRDELARALELEAGQAAQMADSALVLHACLRWDLDCLPRLLGDFALACWRPQQRRLWLARDPMGRRPLFWHQQASLFAFATLPKALFAIPGVPREVCEQRLQDYLCLFPMQGSQTLFKDVHRIEPGQWLLLEDGQLRIERYHHFDKQREIRFAHDDDYVQGFLEHFERAVSRCLRSAGPVASHLSAGYDSGSVTALAARQLGRDNRPLLAFTAVPRPGYAEPVPGGRITDEGPAAQALARCFANIEHQLIYSTGISPLRDLAADTARMDRAPLNPCNQVWINAIESAAQARGVKVMLLGLMGNMTISYMGEEYLPQLFGHAHWLRWWREVRAIKRKQPSRTWRGLLGVSIGPYLPARVWTLLKRSPGYGSLRDYSAVHPDRLASGLQRARELGWDSDLRPWADGRAMRLMALRRVDVGDTMVAANMAGMELRDPTADRQLFEYCLALPYDQYLRQGQNRWLLQRALQGIVPEDIWRSRRRGLQGADWHENIDVQDIRAEIEQLRAHGGVGQYVDLQALAEAVDDWPSQGWHGEENQSRLRLKLLRGLAVGNFVRYVDERNR